MANLTYLSLDDPVDASVAFINGNFAALNTDLDGKAAASHTHSASDIVSGVIAPERLGVGTPSSSMFLRGDGQWTNGLSSDLYLIGNLVAAQTLVSGVTVDINVSGSGDRDAALDLHSYGTPFQVDFAARLWRKPGANGDLELWNVGTGSFRLLVNSTESLRVTSAGNVGIGTSTPTERLDVSGNVKANQFIGAIAPSNIQQAGASTGQTLVWNGSQWAPGTIAGIDSASPYTAVSSSITASPNTRYRVTANNVTITLPSNPANGDWVALIGENVSGCVVARNGRNIMGLAENMDIDMPYFALRLVFVSATNDWRVAP